MQDELKEFEVAPEVVAAEAQIPEKFQGKSVEEVVRSYTELEKLHGRQSREMGDLRKLTDDLIHKSLQSAAPEVKEDPIDIFTEPDRYVAKAIKEDPRLREFEETALKMKKTELLTDLKDRYGNVQEIIADPEFQEWVTASKVRTELFVRADKNFDKDAAVEILDTWKDKKMMSSTKQAREEQEEDLQRGLSSAGSVKGGSGTGEGSAKVYRRADIIRLQITDPKRYEKLIPEIRQAYAEGRVR